MCGRFTLKTKPKALADLFSLPAVPEFLRPNYNVAPTQQIPVVGLKRDSATRGLLEVRWGFVPHWASDIKSAPLHINAKAETADRLPTFRESFRRKRCLIPADGFYEWEAVTAKKKRPHYFRLKGGEPFAFAGLWDVWGRTPTCLLLTTGPNDLVRPVHARMPLILPRDHHARWLDYDTPVADLLALLRPYPADGMEAYPVGQAVSKRADGPECIEPAV